MFLAFPNVHSVAPEWSADKPLITLLSFDGASSIIQTIDSKIWIVWEKPVQSGHAIFCSTSCDYGDTWSKEENLTNIDLDNLDINVDPSITQLSNGTIWVIWSALKETLPDPTDFEMSALPDSLSIPQNSSGNSNITVTSLYDFNDQVDLSVRSILPFSPFITTDLDPPQVTPPPNGEAYSNLTITVGAEATPDDYTITVNGRNEGLDKTRSVSVALTVTNATASSSPASADTTLHTTTTSSENYELYYKVSHDNGTSWSNEKKVPLTENTADDLGPSILQASNGTIWLVWSSTRTDNNEIFWKTSSDFGASWSTDAQLTFNASSDVRPAIAQMQDGRIWVAWHSLRYGSETNEDILFKIYDGSSWTDTFRLTDHTDMDTSPAILQTSDETIRIFWGSSGTGEEDNWNVYFKESVDNGDNWSDRIPFTTDTDNDDFWPAVTQSVDTRIWVTWTTNRTGNYDIYYRTSLVHNIAVPNVAPSHTQAYQEEIVSIDVTLQNYGDYNETFTVDCYANSTLIGTQDVTLNSRASTIKTFTWNTAGFTYGYYRIKANASSVDGEVYTGDNTLANGVVMVTIPGDVNGDRIVDIFDIGVISAHWYPGPPVGPLGYDAKADINGDGAVDIFDIGIVSAHFGQSW